MEHNELCIVSHTHWDREWYMPREKMRFRLVELIDNLLEIFDREPAYIFHLDAQTIVLEDYLQIRPHMREKLCGLIREGRLLVGPWYVQNDFYLSCGESTIRNLQIGRSIAEEFGSCMSVGYVPDQFGLIGQLPQLLRQFSIDNCVFGRGLDRIVTDEQGRHNRAVTPTEFIWKSPDGSGVFSVQMRYWYNNAQRILPEKDQAVAQLNNISHSFDDSARTPYRLLMNGVDHLEAQENLLDILREVGPEMEAQGKPVRQTRLDTYIRQVQEYIDRHNIALTEETDELRYGNDYQVLQGTLSSRVYIKQGNDRCEERLLGELEPLYASLHLQGAEGLYPADYFHYLWKYLIQNHAHDSICGCSVDDVHDEMAMRFRLLNQAYDMLLDRALGFYASHIGVAGQPGRYPFLLFNPLPFGRSCVVPVTLDIPAVDAVDGLTIVDAQNGEVPFRVLNRRPVRIDRYDPINLPTVIDCVRFELLVYADSLPALGAAVLYAQKAQSHIDIPRAGGRSIENELLELTAEADGTVTLRDKRDGRVWHDLLWLEDTADAGSSYIFRYLQGDTPIDLHSALHTVSVQRDGDLRQTMTLEYKLVLPQRLIWTLPTRRRSAEMVEMPFTLSLTLEKGAAMLRMHYCMDNRAEDHRLRLVVRTGIDSPFTYSSSAFEMVKRRCGETIVENVRGADQPNSGVIAIEDGGDGMAMFNLGLHEYEHLGREGGVIALTLVRGNGAINIDGNGVPTGGEPWFRIPGNQCLRTLAGDIALFPYHGHYDEADMLRMGRVFRTPVLTCLCPAADEHQGSAAVQESAVNTRAVRPDPYAACRLSTGADVLNIEGSGLEITAVKKAEIGETLVVRLYNTGAEPRTCTLTSGIALHKAWRANADESPVEELAVNGRAVAVPVPPYAIVTLLLEPEAE